MFLFTRWKKKKKKFKNANVGLETHAKTKQKGGSLVNSQVSPPEHAVKIKILIWTFIYLFNMILI